ncbi:PhzF family phenazine biosynthesis protein [Clostridium cellulovorans]|uniref:Phenazine biosynthesis protein PhzF family n=1 Tax=Clostridium cellulovorans (strain ATCC 35296 / DSM 3052 / OCM 3 / 743B) TaxID=573061 RepID=D9SU66_CLOC7|nr:PhzF family phenazine biosynthesis protein [Clostridium cellulovorans]ADL52821.1 phenazine biosynthesis protein PhzF family [Clostridium cellulovorans 743B]
MRKYKYKKIDAFITEKSLGNPAAYILLEDKNLTPEEMLQIGKDHKNYVSEVVFCENSTIADIKLTYYSSECEVDFCGHGTIAAMYDIVKSSELIEKEIITIETNKKGILTLYNRISTEDAVYITAPTAEEYVANISKLDISKNLGVNLDVISDSLPTDFINAGLSTYIIPFNNLNDMINFYPNIEELKKFCLNNSIDIVLTFTKETQNKDMYIHSRVFAPKFGYLEDPATGSGNSALGKYMLKNHIWDGRSINIEQGGNDRIYNKVMLSLDGDKILFGGNAKVRIEGTIYID